MIDLNQPESASSAGSELVPTTLALVRRLQQAPPITTLADLEQAVLDRQQIGDAMKSVERFFEPLKRMAHQLHAALCLREKTILAPLRMLDEDKRQGMAAFKVTQDRERRRQEQALAQQQQREREAQTLHEAAQLEQQGEHQMAAAVVAEAIAAPSPVVVLADATKQIADLKFRTTWKWRYVGGDKARALALLPREYLTPDESKISAHATSMKGSASIPGIEFFSEELPVR